MERSNSKIEANSMAYVKDLIPSSVDNVMLTDSKKIAEYVEGVPTKKLNEDNGSEMSEEIAIDKGTILQELKLINMKNWQSIVSENVIMVVVMILSKDLLCRYYGDLMELFTPTLRRSCLRLALK